MGPPWSQIVDMGSLVRDGVGGRVKRCIAVVKYS